MARFEKFRLNECLKREAVGESVLDLGAGIFRGFMNYTANLKVGIELVEDYIANRVCGPDVVAIKGDILKFEELLAENNLSANFDVVTLIDVVEHLEKDVAVDLLERAKSLSKKVIVFTPLGFDDQAHHKTSGELMVNFGDPRLRLSRESKELALETQEHRSGWEPGDLEALGFDVIVDRTYHKHDLGAMFAVWNVV